MKFKVGDKVRIIGKTYYHRFSIGEVVTVIDTESKECLGEMYLAYGVNDCGQEDIQILYEEDIESIDDKDIKFLKEVKHHAPKIYEVYEELKRHVGVENAISADDLCCECAIFVPNRKRILREIMREIRRSGELEKIPCSCNKGYYMASTKEEAQKAIDRLVNTAKNELKTAYTMAKKLGLDKQMKIPLGEYFKDTYYSLMGEDDESDTKTN